MLTKRQLFALLVAGALLPVGLSAMDASSSNFAGAADARNTRKEKVAADARDTRSDKGCTDLDEDESLGGKTDKNTPPADGYLASFMKKVDGGCDHLTGWATWVPSKFIVGAKTKFVAAVLAAYAAVRVAPHAYDDAKTAVNATKGFIIGCEDGECDEA